MEITASVRNRITFFALITCLLGTLYYLFETILEVTPTSIVNQLMYSFQLKDATVSILDTTYFFTYTLMQIPSGAILDKFGMRRPLTFAALLACIGLTTFASTQSFSVALASRFITGLGGSFSLIGAMLLITCWLPKEKRAFYLGLSIMIGLSGELFQDPLTQFVNRYGWRSAMLLLGTIAGVFSLFMWLIVRNPDKENSPNLSVPLKRNYKLMFKNPQNWSLAVYAGLMYVPTGTIGSLWGILFLKAQYPSLPLISLANINGLIFLGWIIGSPVAGWFSDRWNMRKPLVSCGAVILLLALLTITYIPHLSLISSFSLFFIIGLSSSLSSLTFAMATEINSYQNSGAAIGFVNMIVIIPTVLLSPVFGYILNKNWEGKLFAGHRVYSISAFQNAMTIEYGAIIIATIIALWWIKESKLCSSELS